MSRCGPPTSTLARGNRTRPWLLSEPPEGLTTPATAHFGRATAWRRPRCSRSVGRPPDHDQRSDWHSARRQAAIAAGFHARSPLGRRRRDATRGAVRRAGRFRSVLRQRVRGGRLAPRHTRRRPVRDGRDRRCRARDRGGGRPAADRRRRHRLRRRGQRPPHGTRARARRRRRHPDRGSGLAQAVRPHGRQAGRRRRRHGAQGACRGRRPPRRRHANHRQDRRPRPVRHPRGDPALLAEPTGGRGHPVRRRARERGRVDDDRRIGAGTAPGQHDRERQDTNSPGADVGRDGLPHRHLPDFRAAAGGRPDPPPVSRASGRGLHRSLAGTDALAR